MSSVARSDRPPPVARATLAAARMSAPLSRPLAGRRLFPLWAVVRHRGRRTGRAYAVPVAIRVSPESFTIPLPWGDETQWLRNVLAAGGCTIRWRGADHLATSPQVMGTEDAAGAFHPLQRAVLRAAGIRAFVRLDRTEPDGDS
jgi:deazaflavin-dependent oxidoreductase (nitroreductase family)